jgi:hypothetical protein
MQNVAGDMEVTAFGPHRIHVLPVPGPPRTLPSERAPPRFPSSLPQSCCRAGSASASVNSFAGVYCYWHTPTAYPPFRCSTGPRHVPTGRLAPGTSSAAKFHRPDRPRPEWCGRHGECQWATACRRTIIKKKQRRAPSLTPPPPLSLPHLTHHLPSR